MMLWKVKTSCTEKYGYLALATVLCLLGIACTSTLLIPLFA